VPPFFSFACGAAPSDVLLRRRWWVPRHFELRFFWPPSESPFARLVARLALLAGLGLSGESGGPFLALASAVLRVLCTLRRWVVGAGGGGDPCPNLRAVRALF